MSRGSLVSLKRASQYIQQYKVGVWNGHVGNLSQKS
jgi:hypothetical protein